jgi:hypothetical protein
MSGAGPGWAQLLLSGLTVAQGILIATRLGQRAPQGWEFSVAALCLMVTFAVPGFVWRILRQQSAQGSGT